MKRIKTDIVIIGAGLTGLALAYFLKDSSLSITLVEARNRIGGRIHTHYSDTQAPIELGATWLGEKHKHLNELLAGLGLEVFEQILGDTAIYEPMSINPPQIVRLPPNDDPSYRIRGGSSAVIKKLADQLDQDSLYLNQSVLSISGTEEMTTRTAALEIHSQMVISTLPPYLFTKSIEVQPALPSEVFSVARKTHTWMGDSIKVGLTYAKPFWREQNLSGTIFSNVGPIPEMYDHSDYEDNHYALKGFFNGSYHSISREERLSMVLKQLHKYYGAQVEEYLTYEETVWSREPYTFVPYEEYVLPHQNGGHQVYQQGYLNNRLYLGGTETAVDHPGYMDGAVSSALFLSNQIKARFQKT